MKFEDFLMERSEKEKKKIDQLQEEVRKYCNFCNQLKQLASKVDKLEAELDDEKEVNRVLRHALEAGPTVVFSRQALLSSLLPPQVQALLVELATVEEEIIWLERKISELKMKLYQEKKLTHEWKKLQQLQHQNRLICGPGSGDDDDLKQRTRSQNYEVFGKGKIKSHRRASMGSALDILSLSSSECTGESHEGSKTKTWRIQNQIPLAINEEIIYGKPNELSEEMIKSLIAIFLELNQASSQYKEGSAIVAKLGFSCMASKGYNAAKTSFNFKSPTLSFNQNGSNIDPYGIMPEFDGVLRDIGAYKNFIQITRHSLDVSRFSDCLAAIGKLRLEFLNLQAEASILDQYLQCLYYACTAFLEHGLPSTQEKLLALMNKAALNVGGIVLNALAIEHFILRHPCESNYGPMDEKEMLLRHAYGLGYPEPNVTFALCRGSWSSPALRIYTADEVVNELGKAKVDYLEASVGVTNKKKILVPKLLQWHMKDFAEDMESLLEWIYSSLPRSGSLKTLIMGCLNTETRSHVSKMIEIQHYEFEFRYLLPL